MAVSDPLKPFPDSDMRDWQIDRRYRIHELMNELLKLIEKDHDLPERRGEKADDQWFRMQRMVDTAFSLWRSAFLTTVTNERVMVFKHMKEFLKKVVEQNAITFADDVRLCELTVKYYNANARYRLERSLGHNQALLQKEHSQVFTTMNSNQDMSTIAQHKLWDHYFNVLVECYDDYCAGEAGR